MLEQELAARLARGETLVVATVIRIDGGPPSQPGAKLLLDGEGALAGTLGCSEFDAAAKADAAAVLSTRKPAIRTYVHDLGRIEVYLEPHFAGPGLLVLGNTPVAAALHRWAPEVGFRLVEGPDGIAELYCVHTDHEAPDLVDRIAAVLGAKPRFVGIMGSRRHVGHHLDELKARGAAGVDSIQTPVGLDIGAQSAEEIALSILAGLVTIRHGAKGGFKAV